MSGTKLFEAADHAGTGARMPGAWLLLFFALGLGVEFLHVRRSAQGIGDVPERPAQLSLILAVHGVAAEGGSRKDAKTQRWEEVGEGVFHGILEFSECWRLERSGREIWSKGSGFSPKEHRA